MYLLLEGYNLLVLRCGGCGRVGLVGGIVVAGRGGRLCVSAIEGREGIDLLVAVGADVGGFLPFGFNWLCCFGNCLAASVGIVR